MKLFKHKRPFFIILIVLLLLFAAKAYYDTNSIEVRHYQIKNSKLGEVLGGLKVALLSDLHFKDMGLMGSKILDILNEEKPDLIFVTGDFISFQGPYEPVLSFFYQLKPPFGVYAILGNTEYSNENGSCILCHEARSKGLRAKQSPVFLRNSLSQLDVNGKVLNILGVDDPVYKRSNLKATLKDINSQNPSILLAHSPEIFEEASHFGIDLMLCGHTHGGQIFLTKYLRKLIPLEASLGYIDGLFQKGKMLMYVSRGIGTSYLPFRFGTRGEITFFSFSNNSSNSSNPSNPANPSNPSNPINSSNPINPSNPMNTVSISNQSPVTLFTGLSLSNLIETFNLFKVFESLGLAATRPHSSSTSTNSINPMNAMNSSNSSNPTNSSSPTNSSNSSNPSNPYRSTPTQNLLFDFESESELEKLNWECHKWFELSRENATSGKYALKVTLPPGQYPGIHFEKIRKDWSGYRYLKMDVFNPSNDRGDFHIRIDDYKSGLEYANRFDTNFELKQGINQISIPLDSIRTNLHHRPLNLKKVKMMMVFLMNNTKQSDLYLDNIRLE